MKRVVEPGWFSVLVGASAEDIRLRDRFEVVAGCKPLTEPRGHLTASPGRFSLAELVMLWRNT